MPSSPAPASAYTRPTPRIRRTLYLIGFAVWATGVLYWTFNKYMLRHSDIGLSENPLQVWWLRLHAAAATSMVWMFGYMCAIHVQRNWRPGVRRNSGTLFVSLLGFLTLTGYLIYYVDADRPLAMLSQWHWLVGLVAPLAFLLHRGLRRRFAPRAVTAMRPIVDAPAPVELAPVGSPAVPVAPAPTAASGLVD